MFSIDLKEIKEISKNKEYKRIPIAYEIYADITTPIEFLKKLKHVSEHTYMLESVEDRKNWGRYTFLGFDPILEFTCQDSVVKINSEEYLKSDNPSQIIREIIKLNKSPKLDNLPPFTGGFVGYFAYDYIKYSESSLKMEYENRDHFKDIDLMLFDKVIAFDNFKQKIIIIVNMKTDNPVENYRKACRDLIDIADLIKNGKKEEITPLNIKSEFKTLFSKKDFTEIVKKAKQHIFDGDIFQVVLSNKIEAEISGSLLDTYRVLRTTNPSPYMFYFSSNDIEIVGASPETLVKLNDNKLYTYPLAGTRPRGKSQNQDFQLERELLNDEKELSEHNMLVDLGRNDIGRISKIGSVKVEKYQSVVKFSHVMHIASTITGRLEDNLDSLDAIDSILPAGTLSGAPKIRACEIINELENNKRGIYGGAIGYIDLTGNLDTCISIRIAYKKNNKVFIRSGAGIVADSIPEKEYDECLNKAASVIDALKIADGGLK